jgi:hypothetical protein
MPATVKADPAPVLGAGRAPEPDVQLLALFEAQDAPPKEVEEEAAVGTPETEEASGDADAEEVATEEAAPEEEVAAAPTLHTVVVDGKSEQVTLDELLAGYSRTGDYTRKTMALSEERRKADTLARDASQERERYIAGLKNVEALLGQNAEEPDWNKLAEELDDAAFAKEHARWSIKEKQMASLRQKREAEEQKAFADRERTHQDYLRSEQAKLYAAVPDWKDEAKARAEQAKLTEYALSAGRDYGITEVALSGIDSAFPILLLRKAMLYDELMAAKPKVVKQLVPTPTAKPGAKPIQGRKSAREAAFERLAATGDPDAAEEYFLQKILDDEAKPRR